MEDKGGFSSGDNFFSTKIIPALSRRPARQSAVRDDDRVHRIAVSSMTPATLASAEATLVFGGSSSNQGLPDSAVGAQRRGQPGFGPSNLSQGNDRRQTRHIEECVRLVPTYEEIVEGPDATPRLFQLRPQLRRPVTDSELENCPSPVVGAQTEEAANSHSRYTARFG